MTADGAEAATAAFARRPSTRPRDAALPFAWSTAATIEPRVEGREFFPRIFADVEAAKSSVHILMFGWREGDVGMRLAALLKRRLADGVEVRVIVDGLGSRPYRSAREMCTGLARAGAEIVVNDVLPPGRRGLFPDGLRLDPRQTELGRADHRKLDVIDGTIAWTGGAGIEELPDDLSPLFPEPADVGSTPVALAQVIPGGHVAATQAIGEQIDAAHERLDVMNAYFTDSDMVERILAAARRGVRVRLVDHPAGVTQCTPRSGEMEPQWAVRDLA